MSGEKRKRKARVNNMEDKLLELDHLQKAEASWFRHWYMALYFASIAIVAGLIGIVHAFIPQLFFFLISYVRK